MAPRRLGADLITTSATPHANTWSPSINPDEENCSWVPNMTAIPEQKITAPPTSPSLAMNRGTSPDMYLR
jgi:hypothetical protein